MIHFFQHSRQLSTSFVARIGPVDSKQAPPSKKINFNGKLSSVNYSLDKIPRRPPSVDSWLHSQRSGFQDGYIAEKTLNPYLAHSVAVTSIPNIGQYVNADGMISCHLPEDELRKVQTYYKGNFKWMPFNTTPEMWKSEEEIMPIKYDPYANSSMGDEPVLEFATSQWEKALQPCIEEIIRADQNDDIYIEKLMQPYLLNEGQNSIFDGTYVAMSMLRWFQWKSSPLVGGLEDQIRNLDGLWEQTPGWGKPSEKRFQDDIDYSTKVGNQQ